MNIFSKGSFGIVAVVGALAGCTQADLAGGADIENTDSIEQGKIIGTNDLVTVLQDGANIPGKYASIIDAFGQITMGCTATHIGGGLVVTAGHCFNAPSTRKNDMPCPGISVHWGTRKDKPSYLTSTCSMVLAEETNGNRDYAIFRVDNVPPVHIDVDFDARPTVDTDLTIFGHPRRRPLEWSKTCQLKSASEGGWGLDQFSHQCDTEPGSSGSSILDDTTLKVVGIHDGGNTAWNYGTYLTNTPIAEFIPSQQ
jgi:V8-like Glu-specific endopeptidase